MSATSQGSQATELYGSATRPYVLGASSEILAVQRLIAEIAPTSIPVLILGESGTGKEVAALQIHALSKQSALPFVKVSCAKFSLESVAAPLNGSQRGSRSIPKESVGTLFLDELDELEAPSQRHLLHSIPEEDPLAEQQNIAGRIVSSTTQELEAEVQAGRFRCELFYRLNGICLRLPPLRHRKEDIPLLAEHFLRKYGEIFHRSGTKLRDATIQTLTEYSWPGNIRELENVMKQMVALENEELVLAAFKSRPASEGLQSSRTQLSLKQAARAASRQVERDLILRTLSQTHWNRKKAAEVLQISYKALLYKLKQIQKPETGDMMF